jgi:hypothetical protein
MASFVAKSLITKLKAIIKNLSEDQLDVNLFQGSASLKDIELDLEFCNSWLRPYLPMFSFSSVKCEFIKLKVPWTRLNSEPIHVQVGPVHAKVQELKKITKIKRPANPAAEGNSKKGNTAGNAKHIEANYTFMMRIIDSMRIDVESVTLEVNLLGLDEFSASMMPNTFLNPQPVFVFYFEQCSFYQVDEDMKPKLTVKKVLRRKKIPNSANSSVPVLSSSPSKTLPITEVTEEEILVFKIFQCEYANIVISNNVDRKNSFELFKYIPFKVKSIMKRKTDGDVSSNFLQICFDTVQTVMSADEFQKFYYAAASLVNALWRPVNWQTIFEEVKVEKQDSDPSPNSTRKKSNALSPINFEMKMKSLKDSSDPEDSIFDDSVFEISKRKTENFLDRDDWTCVRITFDHLQFHLRDSSNQVITLAMHGFDYGQLILYPKPADSSDIVPPENAISEYITTFSSDRIVFIGPKSTLLSDNESVNNVAWSSHPASLMELVQKPLPTREHSTVLRITMSRKWPSVSPPHVSFSQKLEMKEFELNLDQTQWSPISKLFVTPANYGIYLKFSEIQRSNSDPNSSSSFWWFADYRFSDCKIIFPLSIDKSNSSVFELNIGKFSYGYFPNNNPWKHLTVYPLESTEFFTQVEIANCVLRFLSNSTIESASLISLNQLVLTSTLKVLHWRSDGIKAYGQAYQLLDFQNQILSAYNECSGLITSAEKEHQIQKTDTSLMNTVIQKAAEYATQKNMSISNSQPNLAVSATNFILASAPQSPHSGSHENFNSDSIQKVHGSNNHLDDIEEADNLSAFSETSDGMQSLALTEEYYFGGTISNAEICIESDVEKKHYFTFSAHTLRIGAHSHDLFRNIQLYGKKFLLNASLLNRQLKFETINFGGYRHCKYSDRLSFQFDASEGDVNEFRSLLEKCDGIQIPEIWFPERREINVSADEFKLLKEENTNLFDELEKLKAEIENQKFRHEEENIQNEQKHEQEKGELYDTIERLEAELSKFKKKPRASGKDRANLDSTPRSHTDEVDSSVNHNEDGSPDGFASFFKPKSRKSLKNSGQPNQSGLKDAFSKFKDFFDMKDSDEE